MVMAITTVADVHASNELLANINSTPDSSSQVNNTMSAIVEDPTVNLQLLSNIALDDQHITLEKADDELISLFIERPNEHSIVDLPITLPPDNAGDSSTVGNTVSNVERLDDPLKSSTMITSPVSKRKC